MTLKRLLLALLLTGLLLSVPLAMATEETAETAAAETAAVPGGVTTLMFLLGAGAIVLMGGAMLARDSFQSENSD